MFPSTNNLLLGLGFANLIALGWLAAAAAPILIHLWMRQTHRTTSWAAYRFLKAALERQARRLRIQHWILLAIRTAILVLIALAAAKPYLENSLLSSGGEPVHRILLIDNSLSMGYNDSEDLNRFARALLYAKNLADLSNAQDRFSILSNSEQQQVDSNKVGIDRATALNTLDQITLSAGRSNSINDFKKVLSVLASIENDPILPMKSEVVIFTDLLSSDWQDFSTNLNEDTDDLLKKITKQSAIKLVDTGTVDSGNYAITSLRCTNRLPTTSQELQFVAVISSFGQVESKEITATLLVDGMSVDRQKVQVNNKTTEVLFSSKIDSPGAHSVTVRIDDDSLIADNERHLGMNLKDSIHILCVEGRPRAAQYIADALNPSQDQEFPLQPEIVSQADLSSIDLERFDCVVFCNVPEFSQNESLQVKEYCGRGGGAIFFLGDQVIPNRYEGFLSNEAGLLSQNHHTPFRLTSYTSTEENRLQPLIPILVKGLVRVTSTGIDPLDYQHPIAKPFKGNESAGLLSTPVSRIHSIEITKEGFDADAKVALRTLSGDPLLITSSYGSGKIAIMATDGSLQSLDPETGEPWTVMPAWPSFLPLVRGMVESVLNLSSEIGSHEVGQDIAVPPKSSVSIHRPDESQELLAVNTSTYERTDVTGFYDFVDASQNVVLRHAINPNPIESDTLRILAGSLDPRLTVIDQDSLGISDSLSKPSTRNLHINLLTLALLLVLLETGLACWFGRGRA